MYELPETNRRCIPTRTSDRQLPLDVALPRSLTKGHRLEYLFARLPVDHIIA